MSDKQDSTTGEQTAQDQLPAGESSGGEVEATQPVAEKVAVEAGAGPAPEPQDTPAPTPEPAPVPAAPAPAAKGGKLSAFVAWLAFLLVLALGAGAAWEYREMQYRETTLNSRIAELESTAESRSDNLGELTKTLQGQIAAGDKKLASAAANQSKQLQQVQGQLVTLRSDLTRFSANDLQSWVLAEAQYLLRLANQRLIMAGDVEAASALLRNADTLLRELEDADLHAVRKAVAADMAALRAVPKIDVEGLYLQLAALIEQADKLVIFRLPDVEGPAEPIAAESWQDRLRLGYEAALSKLSDYIIIRRKDVPMEALMDPQWEGLVRQNLRMLLEQAQVALLSGNQVLFRESLERAQHWTGEFFDADAAASQALAREIGGLRDATIAVKLPDVSRSLGALDKVVENRLKQGGK